METALTNQMDSTEATAMRAEIVLRMQNWHGDALALGSLLHRFDKGGGWIVLSPTKDDGEPKYGSMWDFFKGEAPKWGLSARYLYELRDQGRAQKQTGVVGWSGSSLKQLAKLNDDPEKQKEIVRDLKMEVVEIRGDMVQRGARPPVAKEVINHVKWAMPNKEDRKRAATAKADRSPTNLKITAIVSLLSDVIDQINGTFVDMDEHEVRTALAEALKLTEHAHRRLSPFKEIADEKEYGLQE